MQQPALSLNRIANINRFLPDPLDAAALRSASRAYRTLPANRRNSQRQRRFVFLSRLASLMQFAEEEVALVLMRLSRPNFRSSANLVNEHIIIERTADGWHVDHYFEHDEIWANVDTAGEVLRMISEIVSRDHDEWYVQIQSGNGNVMTRIMPNYF